MSPDDKAEKFERTESIARRLTVTVFVTAFFFILGFAGYYVSSQVFLEDLATLNQTNSASDGIRQIKQLIHGLSDNVRTSGRNDGGPAALPPTFRATLESAEERFQEILRSVARDSDVYRQVLEAREAVASFAQSAKRIYLKLGDLKQELLVAGQFEIEALEQLTNVQILLKSNSDAIFHEIYSHRYRPLYFGFVSTILLATFAFFMGLQLTRRINRAIDSLLKATARVASGDLAVRAPIINPDEIGSLTHSFNNMLENVRATTVSRDELERANKELEAFSYSVSHDLRAPLRGIDGFSTILLEELGPQLNEEMSGYLRRIRAGVQRMGKLIDDLLNLSKLSRQEMTVGPVDLSAIVHSVLSGLKEADPKRQLEARVTDGIVALADPALLTIVIENLVDNAWKYSSKRDVTRIEFGQVAHEGKPTYFIRDNGAGFDMAYYQKLFGAFQRLHRTDEFAGTGVGLATVQRIIYRHGGEVWAQAAVDRGATFFFTLKAQSLAGSPL